MTELKIPKASEILEQLRENQLDVFEQASINSKEENHEYKLGFCYDTIKAWRKWYLRKNSKYKATIRVICTSRLLDENYYFKYFLQLFRNGKLEEDLRIKHEAFDTLTRGMAGENMGGGLEIYILHKHEPVKI